MSTLFSSTLLHQDGELWYERMLATLFLFILVFIHHHRLENYGRTVWIPCGLHTQNTKRQPFFSLYTRNLPVSPVGCVEESER